MSGGERKVRVRGSISKAVLLSAIHNALIPLMAVEFDLFGLIKK